MKLLARTAVAAAFVAATASGVIATAGGSAFAATNH